MGTGQPSANYLLVSVRLDGIGINQENENGGLNITLDQISFLTKKSYQLKKAVKAARLLDDFNISTQISERSVHLNVFIESANGEFPDFERKLESIRRELHSRFALHLQTILPSALPNSDKAHDQAQPLKNIGRGEIKAFSSLFSSPSNISFSIDFFEAGQETVEAIQNPYVGSLVISRDVVRTVTGEVDRFIDASQKVVLHRLDKFRGSLKIEVSDFEMRKTLVEAQLHFKRVTISYYPAIDPLYPDMHTTIGRLKSIIHVGPAQNNLQFTYEVDQA